MQRSREELEEMSQAELVSRVLEMQDLLREGLMVRDALHHVLNDLLKAKADEVSDYAALDSAQLGSEDKAVKEAWARARHAVSNPPGLLRLLRNDRAR